MEPAAGRTPGALAGSLEPPDGLTDLGGYCAGGDVVRLEVALAGDVGSPGPPLRRRQGRAAALTAGAGVRAPRPGAKPRPTPPGSPRRLPRGARAFRQGRASALPWPSTRCAEALGERSGAGWAAARIGRGGHLGRGRLGRRSVRSGRAAGDGRVGHHAAALDRPRGPHAERACCSPEAVAGPGPRATPSASQTSRSTAARPSAGPWSSRSSPPSRRRDPTRARPATALPARRARRRRRSP